MAISNYLIKKDGFIFTQILSEGYVFDYKPVILNQSVKADGSIKIIYAQYYNLIIGLRFGRLNGATINDYRTRFQDGIYEVWNPNTAQYESYNFIVTFSPLIMISSTNGEQFNDLEVTLTKAGEVTQSI